MAVHPTNASVNSSAEKKTPFLLRPVAPPDEGFLLGLYATTRTAELARSGWDAEQRDAFVRSQYLARRGHYAVRYAGAEHSVITIRGQDAGVWMIWRSQTELRLVNIELLPEYRGQGVGSALLCLLLAEAKRRLLPVHLSVKEENRPAARLYRRLGFSLEARQNGYLLMGHKA